MANGIPKMLVFGSNGGSEFWSFDTRGDAWRVVAIPTVGSDSDIVPVARTFTGFLTTLSEDWNVSDPLYET